MKYKNIFDSYNKMLATLDLLTSKPSLTESEERVFRICSALVEGSKDLVKLFEKEVKEAGITFTTENSEKDTKDTKDTKDQISSSTNEAMGVVYGTAIGFPEALGLNVLEIRPEIEQQQLADFHSMLSQVTDI